MLVRVMTWNSWRNSWRYSWNSWKALMWRHSSVSGHTGHIRSGDTVVSVVVQVTGGVDTLWVSQWNNGRQSAAKSCVHARTPVPQSKLVLLSVTGGGRASPGAGRQWPWTGWSVWAGRGMEPEILCDCYMYTPTMSCNSTILVPAFQAL